MTVAEEPARFVPSVPSAPLGETLLDIRGLSVDYGLGEEPVHAVDDVTLVIRRGEVVGLAGESGSGKSTLAYAVSRLLRDPGVIVAGDAYFYDYPKGSYREGGQSVTGSAGGEPRKIDLLTDDQIHDLQLAYDPIVDHLKSLR